VKQRLKRSLRASKERSLTCCAIAAWMLDGLDCDVRLTLPGGRELRCECKRRKRSLSTVDQLLGDKDLLFIALWR
jgi:hypothetical protein